MTTESAERLTTINRQFRGYEFDYIISNPPFGIEWKTSKTQVERETGEGDRFAAGLPAIGDGQMLFVLNGVSKLKEGGHMAIIQNGSPLFKGDAQGGESNIRGLPLEHDWIDAIIQLPNDLFYNTGIATYIWVISKTKDESHRGKVQLIDASQCFEKRRKSLGNKRVEITDRCRELIIRAYREFANWEYVDGDLRVESRVKDNEDFEYSKVFTYRPLRLSYDHIEYSEQRAEELGIKPADRELLKQIADAWKDHIPSHVTLPDVSFFIELGKLHIKVPAGKIALVRNFYGRKDPKQMEAYVKPTDPKSGPALDPELKDSEIIPWKQDIDEFLDANVRPYASDFWYVPAESKIGYEIPFTREFYRYTAPKSADEIFKSFVALGQREQELMAKIIGGKE